ncbi:MAG TPA: DinB family protein [Lacipirellulaceae bacterium]|jgi:hypothetical protein
MDCKDTVRKAFETSDFLVQAYLGDLTPQEMFVRPLPEVNHAAWQIGHLISAEWQLVEAAVPGSMPKLPAGFAERHSKDTSTSDKAADFLSKEEYFKLAKDVRAGTLAALDKLSPADLDKPVTGRVPPFVKRIGDSFLTAATHWTMHSGQWVVLRRKLGRPKQF